MNKDIVVTSPPRLRCVSVLTRRPLAIASLVLTLFVAASCSDDPAAVDPPPTPVVTALSDTAFSPMDTLFIIGKNFAQPATKNRVVFNNKLASAKPFMSTGDSLGVIVHSWANSGPMHVTSFGVKSASRTVTVLRGIGEPWVVGGGKSFDFKLSSPSGTERYVMVPHSATASANNYAYTVTPDTAAVFPAPPVAIAGVGGGTHSIALDFERHIRAQAYDYLERAGKRPQLVRPSAPTVPAPTRTFGVIKCTTCNSLNASNYKTITADIVYSGTRAIIYADQNQPAGGFTQTDYDNFGMQFDTSIYSATTSMFGTPSDVDGNQRIIILFTPEVNQLTPNGTAQSGFIAGFFLVADLGLGVFPPGTSNGGEMFYALVPDPNGETGNVFPKAPIVNVVPGTLAHEFEHMISDGYRFVTLGSLSFRQKTWLEEGMAHMSEDINGFDDQNIGRAGLFLADPGNISLMDDDTLEQRGGIFLFLRYLGDRFGTGIYKSIVQSTCKGETCIEDVTGEEFFTIFADFLATLYLSNRGITSDPKYNYTSFNLLADFGPLLVKSQSFPSVLTGTIRNAAGDFHLLSGFAPPAGEFDVSGPSGSNIRTLVVRTQ